MKYFFYLITYLFFTACSAKPATELRVLQYEELKSIIEQNDDVLYIVNFWATWCSPCVEELPDFMEVNAEFDKNPKFKMILVSLDNIKELESEVKPFIAKHKIGTNVYLLDDNKRMNEWIRAFHTDWSGSIPATAIYKNGKKLYFVEDKLNKTELKQLINKYL
ncbi:MAG: TlpA disulfide reductase family protein [Paludibacter sp.]|nr:TlpA disulfide reductase family protein [Paludibacter sp.]